MPNPDLFRAVLGSVPTGVSVICTRDGDGRPVGLTVNTLTSVSLEPPMVLFCLDLDAESLPAFDAAEHFAVSLLRADQADVSRLFARPNDRFAQVAWEPAPSGAPILKERLGMLDCAIDAAIDGGDHRIFLGHVLAADCDEAAEPLVHFRGRSRTLGG
ncbi:MAG: flavin reductase family protein [Maricaulaceae bacterium]|jgi:flavin reductase (DIM6/NTAB) family NADH-FMN oxidoreductase RutF